MTALLPILAEDSGSMFGNTLMIAGVLLLLTILLINFRKRLSHVENSDPREKIERQRQINSTKNDLGQMMVELEELTRQFSSQLDAKSRKLESLIEQADQRIARLEGEKPPKPGGNGQAEAPADPTATPREDPLTRNVYQLADAGHDAGEIAQRLQEHIGKVELILALRQHG